MDMLRIYLKNILLFQVVCMSHALAQELPDPF